MKRSAKVVEECPAVKFWLQLRCLWLLVVLFVLPSVPVLAQESPNATAGLQITVEGILTQSDGRWAILRDASETRHVVQAGQEIGEVTITGITATDVRLRYLEEAYSFSFPDIEKVLSSAPDLAYDSANAADIFVDTEVILALHLFSQAFGQSVASSASITDQKVRVAARQASFQNLVELAKTDGYKKTVVSGITVICEPHKTSAVSNTKPAWDSPKKVTLNFINADLRYVLKVLARDSKKDIIISADLKGVANVCVQDTPIALVFPLLLHLQDTNMELTQRDNLLLVMAPERSERRRYLVARAPHPALKKEVSLDYVDADLSYLVATIAKAAGLEARIDSEVIGGVTITSRGRSLFDQLTMILEAQELDCDWKIEDGKLWVWTGEPDNFKSVRTDSDFGY